MTSPNDKPLLLEPVPAYIWPEPRVLEGLGAYSYQVPYERLAEEAASIFGFVSAITQQGVEALARWLGENQDLLLRLIVVVYPTSPTRKEDLNNLLGVLQKEPDRLEVRILPLEYVTDRASNALCVRSRDGDAIHMLTGPSGDLGLESRQKAHLNFVWRADPVLVEAFSRHFTWTWGNAAELTADGVSEIPWLVLPEGTAEAARLWKEYLRTCRNDSKRESKVIVQVDQKSGEVELKDPEGKSLLPPTVELGIPKLDEIAERIARLYEKGTIVTIDKRSRTPPLDAPLNPRLLGEDSELQQGSVIRKVSLRVSVLDEKTLKEIEKRRQGLRLLLNKFTYGLADNMRWMPATTVALFESEFRRTSEEGAKLITDVLKGDVNAFLSSKKGKLITDLNDLYRQLGRSGNVSSEALDRVMESLQERLEKALNGGFLPTLSHSEIRFSSKASESAAPWGQAFSFLSDVLTFPRKVATDDYFLRGLKVNQEELLEVMNIADDAICKDPKSRRIDRYRAQDELDLLDEIEDASIEARDRCELAFGILDGEDTEAIRKDLLTRVKMVAEERREASRSS